MRRILFLFFLLLAPSHAFAAGAVACAPIPGSHWHCAISFNDSTQADARNEAIDTCRSGLPQPDACFVVAEYENQCIAVAYIYYAPSVFVTRASTERDVIDQACAGRSSCAVIKASCDSKRKSFFEDYRLLNYRDVFQVLNLINPGAVGAGISFGFGLLIVFLLYAQRAPLSNFIIHGRLPYKLPVYGEDIQVLFKRTQRVNWYGRVIFGIVANFSMTHDQLTDVRKYWLGRVIAFDSLRRQRKNMLAVLHLQRSKQLQIPKFKKLRWIFAAALTIIVPVFVALFFLFRALISFSLGFLFVRVTIAKLIRGTIIESKNLTHILQAKEAIEDSATYLKDYLELANTFDGRDEVL
jgi:hypothetical protein